MGCAGSKTSKTAAPVWAAPEAKVESAETVAAKEQEVKAEPVETEADASKTEKVEESEKAKADMEAVEEAEKAIGELKESELKSHVESKAEDTETVTTAPKEDSPRCLDIKVEAADVQRGPCVCASLW